MTRNKSLLLQLDLSTAFDVTDYETLLRRLEYSCRKSGTVLSWIRSYLSDREQFASVGGQPSAAVTCDYSVPQGFVFRPIFLTLYVASIVNITTTHIVNHAQYIDDSQLYISLEGNGPVSAIKNHFLSLRRWFGSNGFSLNPDKSDAIVIGTAARHRFEDAIEAFTFRDVIIPISNDVRSLGIRIDGSLSFSKHIDTTCKAASYHIQALQHNRKLISADDAMTILPLQRFKAVSATATHFCAAPAH